MENIIEKQLDFYSAGSKELYKAIVHSLYYFTDKENKNKVSIKEVQNYLQENYSQFKDVSSDELRNKFDYLKQNETVKEGYNKKQIKNFTSVKDFYARRYRYELAQEVYRILNALDQYSQERVKTPDSKKYTVLRNRLNEFKDKLEGEDRAEIGRWWRKDVLDLFANIKVDLITYIKDIKKNNLNDYLNNLREKGELQDFIDILKLNLKNSINDLQENAFIIESFLNNIDQSLINKLGESVYIYYINNTSEDWNKKEIVNEVKNNFQEMKQWFSQGSSRKNYIKDVQAIISQIIDNEYEQRQIYSSINEGFLEEVIRYIKDNKLADIDYLFSLYFNKITPLFLSGITEQKLVEKAKSVKEHKANLIGININNKFKTTINKTDENNSLSIKGSDDIKKIEQEKQLEKNQKIDLLNKLLSLIAKNKFTLKEFNQKVGLDNKKIYNKLLELLHKGLLKEIDNKKTEFISLDIDFKYRVLIPNHKNNISFNMPEGYFETPNYKFEFKEVKNK